MQLEVNTVFILLENIAGICFVFSALNLTSLTVRIRSIALSCRVQDVIHIVVGLTNFTGIDVQTEYLRIKNLFLSHNFIHFASFVKTF